MSEPDHANRPAHLPRELAAVRAYETDYRLLFDANPQPMWVFDTASLRILAVNEAACHVYGYTREEFLGRTLADIRPPADVPALRATIAGRGRQALATARARHLTKDGRLIDVEVTGHDITYLGRRARLMVVEDITERLQAEMALAESERRYRSLMHSSMDAILVADDDGRYVDVNESALALLGYRRDEMLRLCIDDVTPEFEREAVARELEALRAGRTSRAQRQLIRKDGTQVHVELQSTRLPDGRFLATARDVSLWGEAVRQRELLAEREAETAAAQEADRLKTDLINVVSHELRTPLAAIKGFTSALLQFEGAIDRGEQREFLLEVDRAADRLGRLVEDLLLAGRLTSGTLTVRSEPVALAGILREAAVQMQRVTGRPITLSLPAQLPLIRGDQLRLSQVAGNLLSNAVKFSPRGGEVLLRATLALGAAGEPGIAIVVRDRGIGIDQAELPHVFDRFFRASSARALEIGGTGLGLPICHEIIRSHHGAITLNSVLGEGTTVTVWLPAVTDDAGHGR